METSESVIDYIHTKNNLPFGSFGSELLRVEILSGGLVNYVYRLIFKDKKTVVLKYFPEKIKFDKSITMSQNRYFVEKKALEALSSRPWLDKNPSSIIRTPKILFSDDESFVLIMEDAGEKCDTLFNLLTTDAELDEKFLELIPSELKIFLDFLAKGTGLIPTKDGVFSKVWELVESYILELWQSTTEKLNLQEELKNCLEKSKQLVEIKKKSTEVFVMGDLWPSSFLIDQEKSLIWIVDWEAARFETKTSDLEQLLSTFWIMIQSKKFDGKKAKRLIENFQFEFFGDKNSDWRKNCGDLAKENFILWILILVNESHWEIENDRETIFKALGEVFN